MQTHNDRTVLRISAGLFTLAALVWTSVFIANNTDLLSKPKSSSHWGYVPSESEKARTLQDLRLLRQELEPWARRHRSDIIAMRRGDAGSPAAMERVYSAIPNSSRYVFPNVNASIMMQFVWNHHPETIRLHPADQASQKIQSRHNRAIRLNRLVLESNFMKYRDIAITQSTMGGPIDYTLWSTGRITATHSRLEKMSGTDRFTNKDEKEVDSTYSFLPNQ